MKAEVMWISFVALTTGVTILVLVFYKMKFMDSEIGLSGVWYNESLDVRMLLHDIDSEFQGSIIWANGVDKFLGMRIVENLRIDKSKVGIGIYSDPHTGNKYEIRLNMKNKNILSLHAFYPKTDNLAFSQEWKQVDNQL